MLQMKKTSKSDANKIVRKVPTRKSILTEPLPDKIKRKKHERIIDNARKTKQNGQQGTSVKDKKLWPVYRWHTSVFHPCFRLCIGFFCMALPVTGLKQSLFATRV